MTLFAARIACLVTLSTALAMAAPNFSGDWKLDPARSQYGQFPAPASMTRKVQHSDPSLVMSTTQKGPQGEVTTELKYSTDGKPVVNKLASGDAQGSAHWEGDHLVIESSRDVQGGQAKQKEVWALTDGGKTLTIQTHVTVPQGSFDVKQVFAKQ